MSSAVLYVVGAVVTACSADDWVLTVDGNGDMGELVVVGVAGEIGAVELEVVDWGLTAVEVIGSVTEGVSFGSVPNVRFVEFDE